MKTPFGVFLIVLMVFSAQADEYYRSIDSKGHIHYGDQPLTNAAGIEKLKPKSEPTVSDTLPFETERAKEKFPVTLYVAESCGNACVLARELLLKRGIPHTEINLVTVDEIEKFKKESRSGNLPTVRIGDTWMEGYLEMQWQKELDAAGYPKTAPYGVRHLLKVKPAATALPKE